MSLTTEDVGSEGAAGHPQVMGILLCMELVHIQVPETQVPIGGAGNKHLAAGAEGAGYHCCVIHRPRPSQTQPTAAGLRLYHRYGTGNEHWQDIANIFSSADGGARSVL